MEKWQAPGNGRVFDSKLENKSYMNLRSIGVLEYVKEKDVIEKQIFEEEIKIYLQERYNINPNDSTASHFFRPLLFLGFLDFRNENIGLTIAGNLFLNNYHKNNYDKCKKHIINQLDDTKYQNPATTKVNLKLYPFRILFKLLLENETLTREFIEQQLVYIQDIKSLENYLKYRNLDNITKYENYNKFWTWIISALEALEILEYNDKNEIAIHENALNHIKQLYNNLDYSDMFYSDNTYKIDFIVSEKRVQRNHDLSISAKERDNFTCVVNKEHSTFLSNKKNYIEGHHIIPMFQQKNFDFKLDDVNNIVCLCPNCHRKVHFADDKKDILDTLYFNKESFFEKNNVSMGDLYKIYL